MQWSKFKINDANYYNLFDIVMLPARAWSMTAEKTSDAAKMMSENFKLNDHDLMPVIMIP
jgi:hypothetical protein